MASVKNLPLSHLSVEVGHLYMGDFENGEESIRAQFERIRPWLDAARASAISGDETPRVSTCFLLDDYFSRRSDAPTVIEKLVRLAAEAGVTIDYVARESAFVRRSDGFWTAELVTRRILEEPEPERSNGGRPPTARSGWLANGRPPRDAAVLGVMQERVWEPALEYGGRSHSIFLDIELWHGHAEPGANEEEILSHRRYSSPFLSAVWQLVRLGLLREDGAPALEVTDWDGRRCAQWSDLPDIIRANPRAEPFYAYRSVSILPARFLPIAHTVQTIIDHVMLDAPVVESIGLRAADENIRLPRNAADRLSYHFLPGES
ncbi:hypothetical protein ABH926_009122 [Catenulispora sp. GP43]|uniref:SCO2522 family protein n=1 Tax=Catenulispora sp. GP43 TaxID=3156263 RepID=UPI0035156C53